MVALLLALAVPVSAQVPVPLQGTGATISRVELEALLEEYEAALRSPAYSAQVKASAAASAERIRERLEVGDFRVGDRIALNVRNETSIPDTVAVEAGPVINLSLFGEISLHGVLRSELEDHLTRELGRMINNPVVQATSLTRLSVQGAVLRPGFYLVPADVLLSEAIMVAGGPTPTAEIEGLRVQRANQDILGQEETQAALVEGLTLDQLSLQAGDQLFIPAGVEGGFWGRLGQIGLIVVPVIAVLIPVLAG
jgi:protein involved in polysaccharide export with SLBB domain